MNIGVSLVVLGAFLLGWFIGNRSGGDAQADSISAMLALMFHGEMSATEIHAELIKMGSKLGIGGVYPVLRHLEKVGTVTSREVPGGPDRGYRPRRVYRAVGVVATGLSGRA